MVDNILEQLNLLGDLLYNLYYIYATIAMYILPLIVVKWFEDLDRSSYQLTSIVFLYGLFLLPSIAIQNKSSEEAALLLNAILFSCYLIFKYCTIDSKATYKGGGCESVYVLSNPSYPNIYKIGKTTRSVEERMNELNNTSVLTPFKLEIEFKTDNCHDLEKYLHKKLDRYRVNKKREFFKCDLDTIKRAAS